METKEEVTEKYGQLKIFYEQVKTGQASYLALLALRFPRFSRGYVSEKFVPYLDFKLCFLSIDVWFTNFQNHCIFRSKIVDLFGG